MTENKYNNLIKNSEEIIIISTSEHPSIIRIANFISDISRSYFNASLFTISFKSMKQYILGSIRLLYMIRRKKIKKVIIIEPWFPILILLFSPFYKLKLIYYSGNINYDVLKKLNHNRLIVSFSKWAELNIIKKSYIILSDAKSMMNFFSSYNKKGRIFYVPEFIGDLDVQYALKSKGQEVNDFDLNNFFVIGYISTIHIENIGGYSLPRGWELVEICKELIKEKDPNFKFLIIGDGPGLPVLRKMVISNHLENYFIFTGFVNDEMKAYLLGKIDIGFSEDYKSHLTHRFNLSSKVQEYLYAGAPVVTGNQGDKGIIICNSSNPCGICVDPLDDENSEDFKRYIKDLTDSIIFLKANPEILSSMSDNCQIIFSTNFSKKAIKATIQNIFELISGED